MTRPAGTPTVRQVNENQCSHCMPLGAVIALRGVAGSMSLVHGSQGCSTYMRLCCVEHFNEPVDIASSSLNEKQTIHGGEANLKRALDNVRRVYGPSVIGVLSTCLAETMGEDLDRILKDYSLERDISGLDLVAIPTPSYGGSHAEGYWAATQAIIAHYARPAESHNRINIIVPHISPADIRELKRILGLFGIGYTLLPDYSLTLDRPYGGTYQKIPEGGTRPEEIAAMSGAPLTIQFGETCPEALSPGLWLEKTFGVPLVTLPLPIGVSAMDLFIEILRETSGREIPEQLALERGWLLDAMADAHKVCAEARPVIYGEPELTSALVRFVLEMGAVPAAIATGSSDSRLAACIEPVTGALDYRSVFLSGADFATIERVALENGAMIGIGHSGGKFLTERHGIPLVRVGFPIHDRLGGQRILSVGYRGTLVFLDRMTEKLQETRYSTYRREILAGMVGTEQPEGA